MALPHEVKDWSLTTLREKLIKIGTKVVSRSKTMTFQMAEVAVPRALFAAILERIGRLRASPQRILKVITRLRRQPREDESRDGTRISGWATAERALH
jgi:hypothetical protein